MLSEKDNYLLLLKGEMPEYVPHFDYRWFYGPACVNKNRNPDLSGFDMFGVEFIPEALAGGGALPKPGQFMFDDIRKWRDYVKKPDFSDVNWELMAQKDLSERPHEFLNIGITSGLGFFQSLISFMGFTEGLVACVEEPEEVKSLMEFLFEIFSDLGKKFVQYYKPDVMWFPDDIAHELNPFVSLETFRELFLPYWRRYTQVFLNEGVLVQHHNCGHIEAFIPDVVKMGACCWDPAQPSNDLVAIKKKYGNKFAIVGGFNGNGFVSWPETTEEQIRAEVKRVMDSLAPGGGYAFGGQILGPFDDPEIQKRNAWIRDEYEKLKTTYY